MSALKLVFGTSALLASSLAAAVGSHYVKILPQAEREQVWVPAPGQRQFLAGYPDAARERDLDVCVNVGFLIDARGQSSKFVELRSWSSASGEQQPSPESIAPFARLAATVLAQRRYAPARGKGSPTYTAESFSFAGSGKLDDEAIAEHCRIEDLEAVVTGEQARRIQLPILQTRYERRMERGHQCEWFSLACSMMGSD